MNLYLNGPFRYALLFSALLSTSMLVLNVRAVHEVSSSQSEVRRTIRRGEVDRKRVTTAIRAAERLDALALAEIESLERRVAVQTTFAYYHLLRGGMSHDDICSALEEQHMSCERVNRPRVTVSAPAKSLAELVPSLGSDDAEDWLGGGNCSDQSLSDAVQLPDLPLFYVRAMPERAYGSQEMIDLIVDGGRHMSWLMPTASPFVVGDISSPGGGYLPGHLSHRGGIDADIGIYGTGGYQHPQGFLALAPSQLDVEATWALISTFLASERVDFILLDRAHITRLKTYVLDAGLLTVDEAARIFPVEGTRAVWENTGILRHAPHHTDHMHVRVLCANGGRAG